MRGVTGMVEPNSTTQVLEKLKKEGYTEDFKAHKNGMRVMYKNIDVIPEQLVVDKIYRFEGETDLDDEEIIFALTSPKYHLKGAYLVAFGPKMDPLDADIVQRLKRRLHEK
jgi:hypothetical protein